MAVRIFATVVEVLNLKEEDEVEIHVVGFRDTEIMKTPEIHEILLCLCKCRRRLPKDFKFDRIELHERS